MKAKSSRIHRTTRGGPFGVPLQIVLLLGAACRVLHAFPHLLHYLVHTLPRKFEFVRNKAKRFSSSMQIQNSRVSVRIRLRAWSQRAPLPIVDLFEFLNAVAAQLALAAPLSKVTNPRAERQRVAFDNLHVGSRNSAVSFARDEVVEGCNREVKSCDIVHGKNINTTSTRRTDVWAPF